MIWPFPGQVGGQVTVQVTLAADRKKSYFFIKFSLCFFLYQYNQNNTAMDLMINKGIVKKSAEGQPFPYVLKDLNTKVEFPLTQTAIILHEIQEGDIVEFAGRIDGNTMYLAIAGVEQRLYAN